MILIIVLLVYSTHSHNNIYASVFFFAVRGVTEEEDGASDEWAILSKELET